VPKRGGSSSFLSLPLSFEGEGDKGGEDVLVRMFYRTHHNYYSLS